jgi:hypothetical protein
MAVASAVALASERGTLSIGTLASAGAEIVPASALPVGAGVALSRGVQARETARSKATRGERIEHHGTPKWTHLTRRPPKRSGTAQRRGW